MITDHTEQELNVKDERGRFVKGNVYKWSPGQSGNPNGRPKGSKNGSAALKRMARILRDPKTGLTFEDQIAAKLISLALDGSLPAIKEFYDRTEGRPGVRPEESEEMNWLELVQQHGLNKEDVINEARQLIESNLDASGQDADRKA